MPELFVLFEHASGYALFKVTEFEEVGMLLPQLESSVTNLGKFKQLVKLVSFSPFKNAIVALEGINSISEGIVPEDLQIFLEKSLPSPSKKNPVSLGVFDTKLASALAESLVVKCECTGVVPEIIRGIRLHFPNLVKDFTDKTQAVAQLGLSHSYSRAKIKFNVNRVDNMVIQSIALLDQLDKDINTFAMRIREWYSYHFPELVKLVPDNYLYAKVAQAIKDRTGLDSSRIDDLEEIVLDRKLATDIVSAAESSMGMDISPIDLINIEHFAKRVTSLADYRKTLHTYLHSKMAGIAPNLSTLIGDQVGARLISQAGSLTNLAKHPASTVQILGAEKALFRALKTRGNTPKYGLLFHTSFIGRAQSKIKGRISRYLANKCSIASRIDCFAENPSNIFGEKLKQQVEDRLKYYETGEKPKKNIDVMKEALEEILTEKSQLNGSVQENGMKKKKKKKKDKKRLSENGNESMEVDEQPAENDAEEPPKKKKKKKKQKEEDE
ncbi:nucleolar protein 56 isoform X2 [Nilaparvata lugens]|uniref:nucleolar protein 56 isoform X1 n=1 Tax=Nilaparvata lugens TaxID=108931 RepID=UPI000B9987E6|nr:nucleolar protein 56 isoform X1 [Nilaparvata lugens]XP_039282315.1 nucleolar protein 56 isoform X2 [Nilaparvata lugens]